MPDQDITVERIKAALLDNPDFEVHPGKTRDESAEIEAKSKYFQMLKNEAALTGDFSMEKTLRKSLMKALMLEKHLTPKPHKHGVRLTGLSPSQKAGRKNMLRDREKMQREISTKLAGPRPFQKQLRSKFAAATSQAKKMGYKDFSEGSPGRKKRDEIAEAIGRATGLKKGGPGSGRRGAAIKFLGRKISKPIPKPIKTQRSTFPSINPSKNTPEHYGKQPGHYLEKQDSSSVFLPQLKEFIADNIESPQYTAFSNYLQKSYGIQLEKASWDNFKPPYSGSSPKDKIKRLHAKGEVYDEWHKRFSPKDAENRFAVEKMFLIKLRKQQVGKKGKT